jgi:hypothetical protein
MEGKRLEKVNKLLLKELGDIFQKELKPQTLFSIWMHI